MEDRIKQKLFELKQQNLKEFTSKLIPNVDSKNILGIKLPLLRNLAKELYKEYGCNSFLQNLPHVYHEENHLHAFMIEQVKDYDECLKLTEAFLPYVDNWAVCDCFKPTVFKRNKKKLLLEIKKWITSEHTYKIRFAISMLLTHYLEDEFEPSLLEMVANVNSQEYYVKMVVAWYFATALAKQWDSSIKYLQNKRLSDWVHNKTIQKAIESFRITKEQKEYLRTLKIK